MCYNFSKLSYNRKSKDTGKMVLNWEHEIRHEVILLEVKFSCKKYAVTLTMKMPSGCLRANLEIRVHNYGKKIEKVTTKSDKIYLSLVSIKIILDTSSYKNYWL